jgi:hypothetical protein
MRLVWSPQSIVADLATSREASFLRGADRALNFSLSDSGGTIAHAVPLAISVARDMRYIRLAPLGARMVASVSVSAITGRPRTGATS